MTRWTLDLSHSRIGFAVRHLGFSKVRGYFQQATGSLELPEQGWSGAVLTAEIDAESIYTGVADRDAHLRSPDFFSAEQWPSLRFTSTRIEPMGGDDYVIVGDLTIRDITQEVRLETTVLGTAVDPWGGQRVALEARGSVDRRAFGLTWNQVLEAGGVLVANTVELQIEAQAVLQVQPQADESAA